jgi:hypothetical protein
VRENVPGAFRLNELIEEEARMAASDVCLDGSDAAELAELLSFLGDWLAGDDEVLTASLGRFVAAGGYDLAELRADLSRFAFLLTGQDSERLFGDGSGR